MNEKLSDSALRVFHYEWLARNETNFIRVFVGLMFILKIKKNMEKDEVRRRRREGITPKTKTETRQNRDRDKVKRWRYSVEAVYRDEREDGGSKWIKLGEVMGRRCDAE